LRLGTHAAAGDQPVMMAIAVIVMAVMMVPRVSGLREHHHSGRNGDR
jgi:hypothetical protein